MIRTDRRSRFARSLPVVGEPDALERAGLFVAEGRLIVERLLEDGRFRVHSVAVTPAAAARRRRSSGGRTSRSYLRAAEHRGSHRVRLPSRLPGARVAHDALPIESLALATRLLAIEGVGNPDNVGGLFRVALALGADGVLLDGTPTIRCIARRSARRWRRRCACRSRESSHGPRGLDELKARGFRVFALTPDPDALSIESSSGTGRPAGYCAGSRRRRPSARVDALRRRQAAHSDRPSRRFAERRGGRGDCAEPAICPVGDWGRSASRPSGWWTAKLLVQLDALWDGIGQHVLIQQVVRDLRDRRRQRILPVTCSIIPPLCLGPSPSTFPSSTPVT